MSATIAALDGDIEPKRKNEFRSPMVQVGAATGHYQLDDNFNISALRGSESYLLPGPVKEVVSNSPKLKGSLCDSCQGCKAIAFVWIFCWPTLIECGTKCLYCC
ncbi:hypothetical protein FOZ61_003163 [Perkinsus olseni]|uniref:Uncharacterized protein n=1 Tax=Perkinsus olseni TaxID=32597 RepID=A0A7J6M5M2_PEROL|nr:hypothetical protein FOZ61_003163 [Perkinsus olseni]KAF4666807.1 hypothetical protein FOL46_002848 [Perkinsus olseni]